MDGLIKILEKKCDFICGKGVPSEKVKFAEETLGLRFSNEYINYLEKYGIVSFGESEWTGLGCSERLDVVSATLRLRNCKVPDDFYVISEENIDEIVIWQNTEGKVFQTCGSEEYTKIADSLYEFVNKE